jgi:hypothetical protein
LAEMWLNIPQAVVLEATGDLERAKGLEARDSNLLVIKATRLLPPLAVIPVKADASNAETQLAYRKLIEEMDPQTARGYYERALRRILAKLINGVTTKGSRAPNLPLEVIDPAEFARLDLRNIDAVDPRTGETVWYGLLISARELVRGNGGGRSSSELHPRPPKSDGTAHAVGATQIGLSTTRAPPLPDRDLRSWYEKRVSELMARGEAASGEADWEAAKRQFSGRVTRNRLRNVRNQFAPVDWKKQGRRSSGKAK